MYEYPLKDLRVIKYSNPAIKSKTIRNIIEANFCYCVVRVVNKICDAENEQYKL